MKKVLFILGELSDDDIDWLVETGSREEIPAGTVLIHEGQAVNTLYVLLDGNLVVSTAALDGKEIAKLSSGDVVGEMSFIDDRPPSATVRAVDEALVLSIPQAKLAEKLYQDVGFGSRFYRALAILLSNRLRGTVQQLGYSRDKSQEEGDVNELEQKISDNVAIAEVRFDWLLRRLRSGEIS